MSYSTVFVKLVHLVHDVAIGSIYNRPGVVLYFLFGSLCTASLLPSCNVLYLLYIFSWLSGYIRPCAVLPTSDLDADDGGEGPADQQQKQEVSGQLKEV